MMSPKKSAKPFKKTVVTKGAGPLNTQPAEMKMNKA